MYLQPLIVTPAQAGVQSLIAQSFWISAFAEMTTRGTEIQYTEYSIVHKVAEEIEEEVSSEEVDPDWISRFFSYAQDISSSEMQDIWAKILSDEVETPGNTAPRTLECLRNITKEEAKIFEKIKPFIIDDFILKNVYASEGKYNITFENLMALQQAGLVDPNWTLTKNFYKGSNQEFIISINANSSQKILCKIKGDRKKITLPVLVLTQAGKQLLSAVKKEPPHTGYLKELEEQFGDCDFQVIEEVKITKI